MKKQLFQKLIGLKIRSLYNQPGGIVDKEMPIHISNISLFDAISKKPIKIGYKINNNKKVRVNKHDGKEI